MSDNYKCKYCGLDCRDLTHEPSIADWWKCEGCDVSYHVNSKGILVRQNMFVRTDDKIYCLRNQFIDKRATLNYRPKIISQYEWLDIATFKNVIDFTPQQFREKLPFLLLFS